MRLTSFVPPFVFAVLALTSEVRAATWYVDVQLGDDNSGTGTSSLPFNSITKALAVCASGDRILVRPGIYRYVLGSAQNAPNSETFPLTANKSDITIMAAGATKPLITAQDYPPAFWTTPQAPFPPVAVTIRVGNGWTLKDLEIDNTAYNKDPGVTYGAPYNRIHGVYALDLAGSFQALGLEIIDNYWGIWIEDQIGGSHPNAREVLIEDCVFHQQGPTDPLAVVTASDGHAGLMIGGASTLEATVTNCTFTDNHDGLEGGANEQHSAERCLDEGPSSHCRDGLRVL